MAKCFETCAIGAIVHGNEASALYELYRWRRRFIRPESSKQLVSELTNAWRNIEAVYDVDMLVPADRTLYRGIDLV